MTSKRQCGGSGGRAGNAPPSRAEGAAAAQEAFAAYAKALGMEDVLRRVFLLVGKGHHVFIATVCKEWREHYRAAYPPLETVRRSVVGSVERVLWAKKCGYELSVGTFNAAAEFGDVSVCEELHRMCCPWHEEACRAAVRNARHGLCILKWLRSEDPPSNEPCPWSVRWRSEEAGKSGNVEVLEWLLSNEFEGPPPDEMLREAVKVERIDVVEMLVQHPKVRRLMEAAEGYNPWRYGPRWVTREGHLQVLQWLHANARELCRWDGKICEGAVYFAQSLSVLKWLRSEEIMCPWTREACPQFMAPLAAFWGTAPATLEERVTWEET